MHWLNNNRLVYSEGRSFFFTQPASTEVDYTVDLDDLDAGVEMENDISEWATSPDGARLVFTLERNLYVADEPHMFIMDINGDGLSVLATLTEGGDGPVIFYPSWSPDGQWVFAEAGIQPVIKPYKFTLMYLIPVNDPGRPFSLNGEDDQRSPEVRHLWRTPHDLDYVDGNTTSGLPYGNIFWLPGEVSVNGLRI